MRAQSASEEHVWMIARTDEKLHDKMIMRKSGINIVMNINRDR